MRGKPKRSDVMDRLELAWRAFQKLSRSERREFLRMVSDWQQQRRGDHREPAPPVQKLADALAKVAL